MAESTPAGYGFADDPDEPRPAHPAKRVDDRARPKKPKAAKRQDAADYQPPALNPAPGGKKKPSPLMLFALVAPLFVST